MTTRKKIKSNIVKKNFRKTRTINGGIFEPSSLTPLDVTNLNNKSIIKKWREKIKGSIIEDNNEKQTILNELFPHHSLIYKMDDISTMDDIILTKEKWKDKNSIDDSKKYVYYLYNIEDCNIADEDFCEPIKLTPDDIASILNKNNQFSTYNRKKRPRELSPTTISVISPIASVKNIEQNTVFKNVIDLKGGIKRTKKSKKSNKIFRKTRSKKQRGGNQEEKDKYLFDAIDIDDAYKVENALNNGANVNAKNDAGDTPLIHAINFGYIDMVQLLLEHPDISIEPLDVFTNYELGLAEELEEDDQDQSGIPYLIEDYILTKNKIKKQKDYNIEEVSNYKRPNISSLKTMAYYQGPSALDTYINLNPGTINRPYGKLGGKRKSKRKSKKKTRKSKRKTRRK